jgi:hypothetical protein
MPSAGIVGHCYCQLPAEAVDERTAAVGELANRGGMLTLLLRVVEAVQAWLSNRASDYTSHLQIAEAAVPPMPGRLARFIMTGVD